MIQNGIPARKSKSGETVPAEPFGISLYRAMTSVKWVDGKAHCLCCRTVLSDQGSHAY